MSWLMSSQISLHFGVLAFFLALLYLARYWVNSDVVEVSVRKIHFILRAFSWGLFGIIFFMRGLNILEGSFGIARLAILFLMLPEIAYQFTITWPAARKKIWK